jgi:hypothetical protein
MILYTTRAWKKASLYDIVLGMIIVGYTAGALLAVLISYGGSLLNASLSLKDSHGTLYKALLDFRCMTVVK